MSVPTSIFSDQSCESDKRWFQASGVGILKCFVLRAYWELSAQIGHEFRSCSKVFPGPRVSSYLSATTKIALHDKRVFTVMHMRGCGSVLQIRGLLCHQGWGERRRVGCVLERLGPSYSGFSQLHRTLTSQIKKWRTISRYHIANNIM